MVAKRSLPIFVLRHFYLFWQIRLLPLELMKNLLLQIIKSKSRNGSYSCSNATTEKISGVVTDDLGEPLPGVAIQVVGTPRGGNYRC